MPIHNGWNVSPWNWALTNSMWYIDLPTKSQMPSQGSPLHWFPWISPWKQWTYLRPNKTQCCPGHTSTTHPPATGNRRKHPLKCYMQFRSQLSQHSLVICRKVHSPMLQEARLLYGSWITAEVLPGYSSQRVWASRQWQDHNEMRWSSRWGRNKTRCSTPQLVVLCTRCQMTKCKKSLNVCNQWLWETMGDGCGGHIKRSPI